MQVFAKTKAVVDRHHKTMLTMEINDSNMFIPNSSAESPSGEIAVY